MLWRTRYFFRLAYKLIILCDFPLANMQTYDCPYANIEFLRFSRHIWSDWPCALLIVIEKASRTWNCNRLNSNSIFLGITGRRGMRTSSPFDLPFRIVASMTLSINFFNSKSSSIAHSRWIDVAKENYGRTNFEWQYMLRYSWNVQWIKKIKLGYSQFCPYS